MPTARRIENRVPKYDIFLSHSSGDRIMADRVRDELKALGYEVFVDYEALPQIKPDEVTRRTANDLLNAMCGCSSLVYVLSENSANSNWMPWELGFFDGFRGRVFIWPVDNKAEAYASDRRYVSLYPVIPISGRKEYIYSNLPRDRTSDWAKATRLDLYEGMPIKPPLIDVGAKRETDAFARQLPAIMSDPVRAFQACNEIAEAWWRLWGLMPPPQRPGEHR